MSDCIIGEWEGERTPLDLLVSVTFCNALQLSKENKLPIKTMTINVLVGEWEGEGTPFDILVLVLRCYLAF